MAETMLDKAAAAAWPFLWDAVDTNTPSHDAARARMRAALQAIRDAPMSMVEEAAKQAYGPEPLPHEVMNFDGAYTAMIDAILSEGKA